MLAGIEHSVMFNGRGDDMVARPDQITARHTKDRKIVGLRAPAGKHQLGGAAAQQCRHRFAGALDCGPRLLSMMVDGRRVAKALAKVRPHRLQDLGEHRSARVVVEIHAVHHGSFYCTDAPVRVQIGGERPQVGALKVVFFANRHYYVFAIPKPR
jgi:hypothetical protein